MTASLVRRKAQTEIDAAAAWYDNQRAGLGADFLDGVRRMLNVTEQQPESFAIILRSARGALLKRFPYAIHFALTDDLISVIAVLHHKQSRDQQLRGRH